MTIKLSNRITNLNLPEASETKIGVVNISAQSFAGIKTFTAAPVISDASGIAAASATVPGVVTTGAQTLAGAKTFSSGITAPSLTSAAALSLAAAASSEVVVNDSGADVDFRVEGDNNAYLMWADASKDFVTIGKNNASMRLTVDALRADPDTSGSDEGNGYIRLISSGESGLCMDMGVSSGTTTTWIQSRNASNYTANYPLLLNPNGGNVGIGTASPGSKLYVYNSSSITAADTQNNLLTLAQNDSDGGFYYPNQGAGIAFAGGASGVGISVVNVAAIYGANQAQSTTASGMLTFYTNTSGSLTEKMRIDKDGNVGIGTASPASTYGGLDVASGGNTIVLGAVSNSNTRGNGDKQARVGAFHYTATEEPMAMICAFPYAASNNLTIGGGTSSLNAATAIEFYTAANTTTATGTLRMTINSSGNVGIGAGTASTTHNILGNQSTNEACLIKNANTTTSTTRVLHLQTAVTSGGAFQIVYLDGNGTTNGYVSCDTTANTVAYTNSSDGRLKTKHEDYSGLVLVDSIKTTKYERISNPGKKEYGIVAQELYDIYPQAVTIGDDDVTKMPWGIDYGSITPILVKAIQEQQAMIEELKAKVEALENGV